jgi:hypothetical protein
MLLIGLMKTDKSVDYSIKISKWNWKYLHNSKWYFYKIICEVHAWQVLNKYH